MTPSSRLSGATPASSDLAGASTMGRATEVSSASASARQINAAAGRIEVSHHHGERLFFAVLALAQRATLRRRCARHRPGDSRPVP